MKEENLANVLFASIIIGGSTLHKYLNVMEDMEKKRADQVSKNLLRLLKCELGFDEIYAKWLAENLHRLNSSSVKLLESLDSESYQYLRVSTISTFDYDKQLGLFKSRARNIFNGF